MRKLDTDVDKRGDTHTLWTKETEWFTSTVTITTAAHAHSRTRFCLSDTSRNQPGTTWSFRSQEKSYTTKNQYWPYRWTWSCQIPTLDQPIQHLGKEQNGRARARLQPNYVQLTFLSRQAKPYQTWRGISWPEIGYTSTWNWSGKG